MREHPVSTRGIEPPGPAGGVAVEAGHPVSHQAVLKEMLTIIHGPHFHGSRRAQGFLRHVVEQALAGEQIKERLIGVEVFERANDYDTGKDAVVRVVAGEVRKRLELHYAAAPPSGIRIGLRVGSYVPEFLSVDCPVKTGAPVLDGAAPQVRTPWRPLRAMGWAIAGLAVLAGAMALLKPAPDALGQFWQPFLNHEKTVLICVANPRVYLLSGHYVDRYIEATGGLNRDTAHLPLNLANLPPRPEEIVENQSQYVGFGDAHGIEMLSSLFAERGKAATLKFVNDTSFSDLRNAPAVLIGAFSNRWSSASNAQFRYQFAIFDRYGGVQDRTNPKQRWVVSKRISKQPVDDDYAIITRMPLSHTGQPLVLMGGTTHFGTQAASEFMSSGDGFKRFAASLPRGWSNKNLQVVLHCRVFGEAAGPANVVAFHVW